VTTFIPDWMSQERKDLIRSLGAVIRLVSREEGGVPGSIRMAEDFAGPTPGAFLPRRLENPEDVTARFETTGPEIRWQLRFHGLTPDAFVAGVGRGGAVMGVGGFLRSMKPSVRVHPLEPSNSPTLTTGHKVGKHRIQRISDELRCGAGVGSEVWGHRRCGVIGGVGSSEVWGHRRCGVIGGVGSSEVWGQA
jgi:cysteine synthase A